MPVSPYMRNKYNYLSMSYHLPTSFGLNSIKLRCGKQPNYQFTWWRDCHATKSGILKDGKALGFCDSASWANCEVREKTNLPIHQTWKTHDTDTSPTPRHTNLHTTFSYTHEIPSRFTTQYHTKKTLKLISNFPRVLQRSTPHAVTYVLFSWRWA